ncbi:MAG: ACP S-malonyltransferase [Chitinophagales bacterium]|nr:ACP S-malonyltransferase [Chitinophagales bacterium]
MKTAYVFPGQGAQFVGMGLKEFETSQEARALFHEADEILGFKISEIMFRGTMEDLTQTQVTQPAIFIHSVVSAMVGAQKKPDAVAGHSLGEFSSLVFNQSLNFSDALSLVKIRAISMQKACNVVPSTMAAVLGISDEEVDNILTQISDDIVVSANYNCPGQLVISGTVSGIEKATELLKTQGAKRVLPLKVGGAFHSPLMKPAEEELKKAINAVSFSQPICPIYQNFTAQAHIDADEIKHNLIQQLTAPVKWTQSIRQMHQDGIQDFVEFGPGNVLSNLITKIISTDDITVTKFELS